MNVAWIAVDWGTSNLRIWAMDAEDHMIDEIRSDQGIASLDALEIEQVFLAHIEPWICENILPVFACGMVGSREGWREAPYDCVPTFAAKKTIRVETISDRIDLRIIAGVKQPEPEDVIRGEETQIAGFLSDQPDFEGSICLPGTHTKWVKVNHRKIINFQTAMTGELYSLLSKQSVLKNSLGSWEDKSFLKAVKDVFYTPERIAVELFGIRAKNLLSADSCGEARLSGTLIGSELAAMQSYWKKNHVHIIGTGQLANLYAEAIQSLNGQATSYQASGLTLKGLIDIKRGIINA